MRVIALEASSGKIVHDVEIFRQEAARHIAEPRASYASPTPAIADDRVFVSFGPLGSACLSTKTGHVLWRNMQLAYRDDGKGVGSSPVVIGNLFILSCDGLDRRRLVALDQATGKIVWTIDRSKVPPIPAMSYSTPVTVATEGGDLLVSVAPFRVGAHDLSTGREIWFYDLPGHNNVPSPVACADMVCVSTGGDRPEFWCLNTSLDPRSSQDRLLWKARRQVPIVSSPLGAANRLFWVSDGGVACCFAAETGTEIWSERIGGEHFASPVLVEGRIYFFDTSGKTVVMKAADKPIILATNRLEHGFMASPAVVESALFLRTESHLYRIQSQTE